VLGSLLAWGTLALDFEVQAAGALAGVAGALAAQALAARLTPRARFDPRSALISGLSLALLLRTASPALALLAGALAVGSKFLLRARDKHLFNPSCFAIVVLLALSDDAWVSSGQWGNAALSGLGVAGLGLLMAFRTRRSDVTWAFFGFWTALVLGRAWWLGDPLAVPLHQLQSGALLVFAFFMISDPKTIPDTRPGRIAFAGAVAALGGLIRFGLHEPTALLYALFLCAPLVPLLDRALPGERYEWNPTTMERNPTMRRLRRPALALALMLALAVPWPAAAFCGFYVAKADTKLFNRASQVVLVRDGDRSVVTMASDFRGDPEEFAMVIPVPSFIERGQIHVGDPEALAHLDAYTSPRLVEYFDPDPCAVARRKAAELHALGYSADAAEAMPSAPRAEGVRIEARYTVGEYDILILSADESKGLTKWLRRNGYKIPSGAEPVIGSYLRQGMRFFVAKVNLEEHAARGYRQLRPIQVAYESPKFMLPIRLGTVNADGPQELFVYALTRTGRVETTNYRTVKLPSGMELPTFVKGEFGEFYSALFGNQVERHGGRAVFLEYAWDMGWCDPCAADPLSLEELRGLGVFWLKDAPARGVKSGARDVYVTRLHVRYDREHFPADLQLQETGDRSNFQGRYVLRHAFQGETRCTADAYWDAVRRRQEREAEALAGLTGWKLADVRRKAGLDVPWIRPLPGPWWRTIWD
jgi:hypothetical protein